ncbi:MAG: hypothetical protein QNK37_32090 [Acidobacteriota bacterium]|nr:hypothetical protein [Acidobacteriota bacterium]
MPDERYTRDLRRSSSAAANRAAVQLSTRAEELEAPALTGMRLVTEQRKPCFQVTPSSNNRLYTARK